MVDHLQNAALNAQGVEGKQAQHHEAQVAHRRVGHQFLEVFLSIGDHRAVNDADNRQHRDGHRVFHRRLGEERQVEAQEAVSAHLQQDARQNDRTGGGRFHMGVGQPRVQRPHGHFDGKGQRKGEEQPRLQVERQIHALSQQVGQVEGALAQAQPQNGKQHQHRADHGVEHELDGRVGAPRAAPNADDEVHRHQAELPEHEEGEQIQRQENAQHADFHDQEGDGEFLDAVLNRRPRGENGNRRQQGGQQHQQDAQAVHAHGVVDFKTAGFHPDFVVHHLEVGVLRVEHAQHPQRNEERDQGSHHRHPADGVFPFPRDEQNNRHPHQREEGHQVERIHQEVHHATSPLVRILPTHKRDGTILPP